MSSNSFFVADLGDWELFSKDWAVMDTFLVFPLFSWVTTSKCEATIDQRCSLSFHLIQPFLFNCRKK